MVATTGGVSQNQPPTPAVPTPQPAPAVAPSTPTAPPAAPVAVYTVMPGDNLSGIAKRYYGSTQKWPMILEANRDQLSAPEKLKPGMSIKLPPAP